LLPKVGYKRSVVRLSDILEKQGTVREGRDLKDSLSTQI
jgi:hypothetical protein